MRIIDWPMWLGCEGRVGRGELGCEDRSGPGGLGSEESWSRVCGSEGIIGPWELGCEESLVQGRGRRMCEELAVSKKHKNPILKMWGKTLIFIQKLRC